ncbi:MAG: heparan-alpha-glucosaminide N-acetyltransferase [Oscillospiraceae bacterium]
MKRIDSIDALRGLAVVLMVIHHFLLDLVELCGAPGWLFSNPVFDILHYIFAGLFIFLSGVSSNFSHSNIKRGVKVFAIAMGMTVVTTLIGSPIRFGVLHLLGFCMVFYGLTHKAWESVPRIVMPVLCVALLVGSSLLVSRVSIGGAARYLFMFGWTYKGFYSADYFPIFPWLFVFLLGTWAGAYIKEYRLPKRFYEFTCPVFPKIGRMALIIYIVHQPVLYGLIYAVKFFY